MGISTIRAASPLRLVDGGEDLQKKAATLDGVIGDQVRAVHKLEETWKGSAANAARASAYRLLQRQHRTHEILAALSTTMTTGGWSLVHVRDALLNWVDTVLQMFNVSDDGVVTTRPPHNGPAWTSIATAFTKCTQALIKAFMDSDARLANQLNAIAGGNLPGSPPGVDPDSFNNPQITYDQNMAGFGNPADGSGGVGVPNTDLSIMGMTPDGRMFTIQGDSAKGSNPDGGPGPRLDKGGNNNIIYWKMDEHGKWVPDEVVNNPFPTQIGPDGKRDISTIPTSTFNVGDTMYTSVMNVSSWNEPRKFPGQPGWYTNSSQLYKSNDGGKTWNPAGDPWQNNGARTNPFQVQSFTPSQDGKYVYMYGTQDGRTNDGLHAARVPVESIENHSAYEYWDGNKFSANQGAETSPPIIKTPPGVTGIGEPNVHFYENKVLVTFNDEKGGVFTSSSVNGEAPWTSPTKVVEQSGLYGAFQSPFSGGDSISTTLSVWNPYGTALYDVQNKDTQGLGAY